MGMRGKRMLSLLLTLVLTAGCFAGTGVSVKASSSEFAEITEIIVDDNSDDTVTVTVNGTNLGEGNDIVTWKLFKWGVNEFKDEDWISIKIDGKDKQTSAVTDTENRTQAKFTIALPTDSGGSSGKYKIEVVGYDLTLGTSWYGQTKKEFTVAAAGNDKSALDAVIKQAEGISESAGYTSVSYNNMKNKLAEAKTVYEKADADEAEITAATNSLKEALDNLHKVAIQSVTANPAELTSTGGTVKVTVTGIMEDAIWYRLQKQQKTLDPDSGEERNEFVNVGDEIADPEVKIEAGTEAEEVTFDVEIPQNTTAVDETYRVVVKRQSWAVTWEAAKATITVAASENPDQVNKTSLEAAIADAQARTEAQYTKASWAKMLSALKTAQEKMADSDATQVVVDAAAEALTDALKALEKLAEVTELTVSKTALPTEGGEVTVQVKGTDLNEGNWDVEIKQYRAGGTTEIANSVRLEKPEVTNKTAGSAVIKFGASKLKYPIDIVITAGALDKDENGDSVVAEQQTAKLTQEGYKLSTVTINLVDESGNAVTDPQLKLSYIDVNPGQYTTSHSLPLGSEAGQFVFDVDKNEKTGYRVSLDTNTLGYKAEPIVINLDWGFKIADIDGEPYTGEPIKMVLKKEAPSVDKTDLNAVIKEAEAKNAKDYMADKNWTAMQNKLKAAKEVSGKADATEAQVKAAADELRAALKALVKKPVVRVVKVKSIKLSAASTSIAAGKKVQLKVKVTPSNATNKKVTYTSSNKKYATVSSTGKVTLKKAGAGRTVTITATAKDGSKKKAALKIRIMKNSVKSIKLKAAKTVKVNKSLKVKATVKATGKKANTKLTWTSSNTKYATVSSKGVVKAKRAGKGKTVRITAKAMDGTGKKATVKIKIK